MKKYLLGLMSIVMMAVVCVGFTACGSDDDDGGGSGKSGSDAGEASISVNYGFYQTYAPTEWALYFSNYDLTGTGFVNANDVNILEIDLDTSDSWTELPVGTFSNFRVTSIKGMSTTGGEPQQYYEGSSRLNPDATLTIQKSGNNYTVSFKGIDLYGDDSNTPTVKNTSFNYSGSMKLIAKGSK